MADIELTDDGIYVATDDEILVSAIAKWVSLFGESTRVNDPDSPDGRFVNMIAEVKQKVAAMFRLAMQMLDPTGTTGIFLENLMQFNGITINSQEFSTVILTMTANSAGVSGDDPIPAGFIVTTESGNEFSVDTETTLLPLEVDNTIEATAVLPGPISAGSGDISVIPNPHYGLLSVTNASPAVEGEYKESYPAARARRWRSAQGVGMHHPIKIRAMLENLPNVVAVALEVNNGVNYLASGVPPGHIRAIVKGGADQDIADCLFGTYEPYQGAGSVGGGIGTWGAVVVTPTNPMDASNVMRYDRSSDSDIHILMLIRVTPGEFPSNGDSIITDNILKLFAGTLTVDGQPVERFGLGDDIYGTKINSAAAPVTGCDVIATYVGTAASPTQQILYMDINEWAQTSAAIIEIRHE